MGNQFLVPSPTYIATQPLREPEDSFEMASVCSVLVGISFINTLSEKSIFVQSSNINVINSLNPTNVCKIPPHYTQKVFNNVEFVNMLVHLVKHCTR